jgi:hypothetical protein
VDALVPKLELRVLCLEHWRAGIRVRPILEILLVVISQDIIHRETLCPRVDEPFFRTLEVIFDMTLAAHK